MRATGDDHEKFPLPSVVRTYPIVPKADKFWRAVKLVEASEISPKLIRRTIGVKEELGPKVKNPVVVEVT